MNIQHRRAPHSGSVRVFRIQDREGRGPFRPGFSQMWVDADSDIAENRPRSWIDEFGLDAARAAVAEGATVFSAVRTIDKLRDWFSDLERQRLYAFGYFVVEVPNARIIRESVHQLLCRRDIPLTHAVTNRRPI